MKKRVTNNPFLTLVVNIATISGIIRIVNLRNTVFIALILFLNII